MNLADPNFIILTKVVTSKGIFSGLTLALNHLNPRPKKGIRKPTVHAINESSTLNPEHIF